MVSVYEQEIARLREISADMEEFLKNTTGAAPGGKLRLPSGNFLTSLDESNDLDDYFNKRATPKTIQSFQSICKKILELPKEYETLITDALSIPIMSYGAFKRWGDAVSAPQPDMMPKVIETLHYGTNLIINESPETREFRRFHLMIRDFCRASNKAVSGTRWTRVDIPREDVPEYNEQALRMRDAVRAQFERLDENYLALMNERLLQYKPATLAESLAPMDDHDDPEKMEIHRAQNRAYNKEILEKAAPYQTGERTIRDIVGMLDTDDFQQMYDLAVMASMAADLYYKNEPLLTFNVNKETGKIENMSLSKPEPCVLQ